MRHQHLLLLAFVQLSACTVAPGETDDVGKSEDDLRRLDFLQNRSMNVIAADGHTQNVPLDLSNTFSANSNTFASVSSVRSVNWAGDANSYVDVFENPLTNLAATTGRVLRYHYPFASNSQTSQLRFCFPGSPCPTPTASPTQVSLAVSTDLGRNAMALRVYDAGECAGQSPWSAVATSIGTGIASQVDVGLRAKGLGATTLHTFTVTPMLGKNVTDMASDRVRVKSSYDIATCGGRLYIDFIGTFAASSSRAPTFTVEPASIVTSMDFGDDACAVGPALVSGHGFDVGGLQNEIASGVRAELLTQLSSGIGTGLVRAIARAPLPNTCRPGITDCLGFVRAAMTIGGFSSAASALTAANAACLPKATNPAANECVFVPNVQRINTRVDGIEVVLASFATDPFVAPLRSGGLCDRPEPPAAPTIGFPAIREPHGPGGPHLDGNHGALTSVMSGPSNRG